MCGLFTTDSYILKYDISRIIVHSLFYTSFSLSVFLGDFFYSSRELTYVKGLLEQQLAFWKLQKHAPLLFQSQLAEVDVPYSFQWLSSTYRIDYSTNRQLGLSSFFNLFFF